MRRRHSLRLRVALAFAGLGAALSLLLSVGIWFATHDVAQRLMDQTLTAELEDYMARRARNPNSLPPDTASLRGYLGKAGAAGNDLPEALRMLSPGRHEIVLDGIHYRVAVGESGGDRHVILFNEERQRRREQRFLGYLAIAAATMTLFAAIGGLWMARRVIAPVTRLARTVGQAAPEHPPRLASGLDANADIDEIDELAHAFDSYVARIAAFVERERNFAADASHELRTPLAVILGAVEVLADDPHLDEAQRRRVARIERAAVEMTELIATLLLLAREEEPAADESCDATRIAARCVARYRKVADEHGTMIELLPAGPAGAMVVLPVPAALFAIVVANLVRNAVAHTRGGRVSIALDAQRLVVRDTGSGIGDEARERVFERYYRGPDSKGTGIGLSLVKRICERMGWRIGLESDAGAGTVVTVSLGSDRTLT